MFDRNQAIETYRVLRAVGGESAEGAAIRLAQQIYSRVREEQTVFKLDPVDKLALMTVILQAGGVPDPDVRAREVLEEAGDETLASLIGKVDLLTKELMKTMKALQDVESAKDLKAAQKAAKKALTKEI